MATMTYKFETKIAPAASTARKRTGKYAEEGAEPMERFGAKSLCGKDGLCPAFQKGGL